jgi:hypothetical protein
MSNVLKDARIFSTSRFKSNLSKRAVRNFITSDDLPATSAIEISTGGAGSEESCGVSGVCPNDLFSLAANSKQMNNVPVSARFAMCIERQSMMKFFSPFWFLAALGGSGVQLQLLNRYSVLRSARVISVIMAQFSCSTASAGTSQDPPTQATFFRARYSR